MPDAASSLRCDHNYWLSLLLNDPADAKRKIRRPPPDSHLLSMPQPSSLAPHHEKRSSVYGVLTGQYGAELGQNPTDKEFFEVVSTVDREMKGVIGERRVGGTVTLSQ